MSDIVYLVDGSGYIFRAFYAIAPLSTRSGFPTNALFGFTRMLRKLLQDAQSNYMAVAFDVGRETFRLKLYPRYKANRAECPSELLAQLPYFRQIASALGLPVLELPGYEADDVIGTLADRLAAKGKEVVIVSGDKDLMQLVRPGVTIWDPLHDKHYGEAEVKEKFGVPPGQVVEVLALSGDSSDNVPGVQGIGPKTAAQLVEKYGNVEGVLSSLAQIKEDLTIRNRRKISEQIELDRDILRLSRKLVEIDVQAPVAIKSGDKVVEARSLSDESLMAALCRVEPNRQLLRELVERFEFSSLLSDLDLGLPGGEIKAGADNYITIKEKEFPHWLNEFVKQREFAFDVETTSLDALSAKIVGVSFCWSDECAYYLPLGHLNEPGQAALEVFLHKCGPIFAAADVKKYGQNLKYDVKVLARHGVDVRGLGFDTMVAAYLLNPDKGSYNLTALAREFLDRRVIEYDEVAGQAPDFSYVSPAAATRYACQDAHYAWLLKARLEQGLRAGELMPVLCNIEMPLVSVLARMELEGVGLDVDFLAGMSQQFALELEQVQQQIYQMAGVEFNINSPKQLAEVLFNKLGISSKGLKRTKTGVSTDSSVLEKLSLNHPLPGLILHHRFLHKLKSTYIDALPAQVSPVTKRLHTNFNQTGTATGRLSSSDPNLQNIPIQTAEGARIRAAFVAPAGRVLISADYSQIELRLLAHMSGDENMIQAFKSGVDIHARTAREILDLSPGAEVSPEQRRLGKTINFGIVYGMSGFRLARELGIPLGVANAYIEGYFAHYPAVREFFDSLEKEARQNGYVRTIFGRKRVLAEIDTSGRDEGFVVRAALNAPLQGSAADVIKRAMVRIDQRIGEEKLPFAMVLQIHDELLFECDAEYVDQAAGIIKEEMEQIVELKVPLKVDVGWGRNWQEAHV